MTLSQSRTREETNYDALLRRLARQATSTKVRQFRGYGKGWHESRAPDGVASYGQRLVRRGGFVRIGGVDFHSEKFEPLVGYYVGVNIHDYWMQSASIWWESYPEGEWIFDAFPINTAAEAFP